MTEGQGAAGDEGVEVASGLELRNLDLLLCDDDMGLLAAGIDLRRAPVRWSALSPTPPGREITEEETDA